MYKIRITPNQIGMQLEQYKDGEWRGASPIFKPEDHGGVQLLKSKILMALTDPYDLMPVGEYKDAENITVNCI